MIQVLGTKRIVVLVLLLLANAALGAVVYMHLVPDLTKKERSLRSVKSNVRTLQSDIARLQIEFEQLEYQQAEFDVLKKTGFFSDQGRRQAELLFEKIQKQAGVVSAVANIKGGELQENEEAKKAEHVILTSPIELQLEALDDVDVFKYVYLVEKFFPGHLTIESINLQRTADINGTVLRSIASGNNLPLVSAEIKMTWRTMIPKVDGVEQGGRL